MFLFVFVKFPTKKNPTYIYIWCTQHAYIHYIHILNVSICVCVNILRVASGRN